MLLVKPNQYMNFLSRNQVDKLRYRDRHPGDIIARGLRLVARDRQLERAARTIRFRKNAVLAARVEFIEKRNRQSRLAACVRAGLPVGSIVDRTDTPSIPSTPHTDASHHPVSLDTLGITLKQALSLWRAANPRRSSEIRREQLETKRQNAEIHANRRLPHWTKATEADRAPAYAQAIIDAGNAVAVSINIDQSILERAGKAEGGAFDYIRRRITRRLKQALGFVPAHTLALDVDASGRLHLHGYIEWPGDLIALRDVLRLAVGVWEGKAARHQIHLRSDKQTLLGEKNSASARPLSSGFGCYSVRRARSLREQTNHSTLYASPNVKQFARTIYEQERSARSKNKITGSSINTYRSRSKSAEMALDGDSQISDQAPVNAIGWGKNDADADHEVGRIREHLRVDAPDHLLRRDDRRTSSGAGAGQLHDRVPHERGRVVRPARKKLSGASCNPIAAAASMCSNNAAAARYGNEVVYRTKPRDAGAAEGAGSRGYHRSRRSG